MTSMLFETKLLTGVYVAPEGKSSKSMQEIMLVDAVETEANKETEARAMVWMVFMTIFLVMVVQ